MGRLTSALMVSFYLLTTTLSATSAPGHFVYRAGTAPTYQVTTSVWDQLTNIWDQTIDYWKPKVTKVADRTVDYWKPKVTKVADRTVDYWKPKVTKVADRTIDYWKPKVARLIHRTSEYWNPKITQVSQRTTEYWTPILQDFAWQTAIAFNKRVHPRIIRAYQSYQETIGAQLSQEAQAALDYLRPIIKKYAALSANYWYSGHPDFFQYWLNVPPLFKKMIDYYITTALSLAQETLMRDSLPEGMGGMAQLAAESSNTSDNIELTTRLERLLNKIRPYAADPGMRDCYKIRAFDSEIINAFNTGCAIYVSSAIAEVLTDDELAAILAHEVSHGDRGHSAKNLYNVIAKFAGHMGRLIAEEMEWLLTGHVDEYFQRVIDEGNILVYLESFSELGPVQELEADIGAVNLFKRANLSIIPLITALKKLHGVSVDEQVEDEDDYQGIRDYPSLYKRINAIKATADA